MLDSIKEYAGADFSKVGSDEEARQLAKDLTWSGQGTPQG
jgi:lysyl-tRNA synthetase class II